MATASTISPLTVEEFVELQAGFDRPVELITGEIVEMSQPRDPRGAIAINVGLLFKLYKRSHGGRYGADGIVTGEATVRGPDVYYISSERLGEYDEAKHKRAGFWAIPPTVCVEVISPNETSVDIQQKIEDCIEFGVDEFWIIEPELRSLQLHWPSGASRVLRGDDPIATQALPELTATVAAIFEDIE